MRHTQEFAANRNIVVINQFALPREESGGTRHVDLYGDLGGWQPLFIAGNINHSSTKRFKTKDNRFKLVSIPRYSRNGPVRIAGWFWFTARALLISMHARADVYVGSSPHPLAPAAALVAARVLRKPFILEVRDLWPESIVAAGIASEKHLAIRILRAYERFLYRSSDAIIGVTPGWRSYFSDMGISEDKLCIVTNGTSSSAFAARISTEERNDRRAALGIAYPAAIFAGSHGPKDGIKLILDAAERLPHVNFYLYGGGSDKDNCIRIAKRRELSNVTFKDGVPKADLPDLLSLFDVGLHVVAPLAVFDRGMSPNKLFDYLAAGLPVVSNARIPLKTVISDGDVGAITEPEMLADGLMRVLTADASALEAWAIEGRRLARDVYSRETQKEVILALLCRLSENTRS